MASKPKIQRILAKTSVVELDDTYDYLFMFDKRTGLEKGDIMAFMNALQEQGISGIGLYMKDKGGVQLYKKKKDGKEKK